MNVAIDTRACVYTIALPERILEASRRKTPLHEAKRWIAAREHHQRLGAAAREGAAQKLAILFADSRDCSKLIGWSVLESLVVRPTGTDYMIGKVWGLGRHTPQELMVLSTKRSIAEGHIRPYVVCEPPAFLLREARKPRPWDLDESAEAEAREGLRRIALHQRLERASRLVDDLKRQHMKAEDGHLRCEVCEFDFLETYGDLGFGFAEAHHIDSLANYPKSGRVTSVSELAIVCANCHRMLHRGPEYPTMESLRRRVKQRRKPLGKTGRGSNRAGHGEQGSSFE